MRWRNIRRIVPWLAFLAILALVFFIHRCSKSAAVSIKERPPVHSDELQERPAGHPDSAAAETTVVTSPKLDTTRPPSRRGDSRIAPTVGRPDGEPVAETPKPGPDTLPYVFADPWGGRHFDSVTVRLHCKEDCVILYSTEDSVNLRTYNAQMTFRRNTTLWFAGISTHGNRTPPVRLDYVIEKNPGNCAPNGMPVSLRGHDVCVDVYEWPNREDAQPLAMISQAQAADSCRSVGKHLCSLEEWRSACQGPDQSRYPYGTSYDERYCPAQQAGFSRSGRFPACRSYYGVYDLTGNLWEWTSTVNPDHDDFFYVAGGNWETAEKGTCSMAKYSFYPQNTYPMVGFRCCAETK